MGYFILCDVCANRNRCKRKGTEILCMNFRSIRRLDKDGKYRIYMCPKESDLNHTIRSSNGEELSAVKIKSCIGKRCEYFRTGETGEFCMLH